MNNQNLNKMKHKIFTHSIGNTKTNLCKATITLLLVIFTSIATFGQTPDISGQTTTETRYYNGKYTKETVLQKVNKYIIRLKNNGFIASKVKEKSAYHFTINWQQQYDKPNQKMVVVVGYIIGDDNLTLEIKAAIYFQSKEKFIILDRNHKVKEVGQLYNNQVGLFIDGLFKYLEIENNTTQPPTAGSNTNISNLYSGLSTEAAAYMALYKMNPKGLKNYIGKRHNNWVQKGYSEEKISQTYADLFGEVYAKDKYAAFTMILHLPDSWLSKERLGGVFSKLTKEQQLYIQDAANNYKTK